MADPNDMPFGTYLIPQTGGIPLIYFDCVISETITREAETTEFPVEVGANISDHYRVKLTSIKLDVFCSEEPITESTLVHPGALGAFYGAQIIDMSLHQYPAESTQPRMTTVQLPPYPAPSIAATIATGIVNPTGLASQAIGGALNSAPTSLTVNSYAGAPAPSSFAMQTLQFPQAFNALSDLLQSLDAIRAGAVLVDVVTKSFHYPSFALTNVTVNRDKDTGTGAKLSLEFKAVVQVQTQTTGAPPVPQQPKDKPTVAKGAQQPQDPGPRRGLAEAVAQKVKAALPHGLGGP